MRQRKGGNTLPSPARFLNGPQVALSAHESAARGILAGGDEDEYGRCLAGVSRNGRC